MLEPRKVVALFLLMGVFCVRCASAQDVAHSNSAKTDLNLVTVGHRQTKSGHITAFRIYEAPDGTKGQINYTKFDSLPAAQQQIDEWIKPTSKVTSREQNQSKDGQLISDRILAVADLPKSDKKEFVIIRRDDLNCYLIEADSLRSRSKSKTQLNTSESTGDCSKVVFRGQYESEIPSGSGGGNNNNDDESRASDECRSPEGDAHEHDPCQRFFRRQDGSRRSE